MKTTGLILCGLAVLAAGCKRETTPEPSIAQPEAVAQESGFACGDFRLHPSEVAWHALESGTTASFRGLDAVSDEVVWVSGTGGTWGRSTDGGATWVMRAVPGAEELELRDVDAFDDRVAYLMSAGPGETSRIYKTTDGGETWELQHTNPDPDGFYDGMAFWDADRGLVYGDPVGGRFVVRATEDGGATWSLTPGEGMPPALAEEAGFAASGSGLAVAAGGHAWFGTGGKTARVFRSADHGRSWSVAMTPMLAGESSSGIFSLAFADTRTGAVVGGDYTRPEASVGNAARTEDGGAGWGAASSPPAGYRSAVAYAPGTGGRALIAVGTSGSDLSLDGGETWMPLGTAASAGGEPAWSFNAVSFGSSTCAVWAAGPAGRLARLGAALARDGAP